MLHRAQKRSLWRRSQESQPKACRMPASSGATTSGGQFRGLQVRESRVDQKRDQRQAALNQEDADSRQQNPPPESGGEDDRGYAVERRLDGEQRDIAARAVEERAQHGKRPHAEDQAGRDEGEAHPSGLAVT